MVSDTCLPFERSHEQSIHGTSKQRILQQIVVADLQATRASLNNLRKVLHPGVARHICIVSTKGVAAGSIVDSRPCLFRKL